MDAVARVQSRTTVLPLDDIDTDQIIPARFLTTTSREGLGANLFADWRYDAHGDERPDFALNTREARDAQILVAGRNFGCGSSREHAAWALLDYGIRAVISTEIADIFRNNALKNGLLPVIVEADIHQWLIEHPGAELAVDLQDRVLILPDGRRARFPVDSFSRYCLLNGIDQLGFLLEQSKSITAYEARIE